MRWNTTLEPNDLNMRLHISSWNKDGLIKVWRESSLKYSLLCSVGCMYYLWCRMNDWLPWILICEVNEERLPLHMQCYRKVFSSSLWCGKSWDMAHFIYLSCNWKVNRQSCFSNEDLQSPVVQMLLFIVFNSAVLEVYLLRVCWLKLHVTSIVVTGRAVTFTPKLGFKACRALWLNKTCVCSLINTELLLWLCHFLIMAIRTADELISFSHCQSSL